MTRRLFLILALSFVILAVPGQAQEGPSLESLEMSLWPEFDRPEVLVIYRGQLDADVPLPAPMEIWIPARVGQPTAVAYVDETGQRLNQQYTTRAEGDQLVVAFELVARGFQLEYYDALPADTSGKRTYTYTYTADYPTTALNMEVQVPPTAQGFTLDPPADTVVEGEDGLTYHLVQAGALASGDTRDWTFTYVKNNSELTAAGFVQPEAAAPSAGEGIGDTTVWIFLIAFVALIAVGVTGYWLGHRTQVTSQLVQPTRQRQKRRGSGRGDRPQPPSAIREARFCHECGVQLRPDSVFCHECGASVRGE